LRETEEKQREREMNKFGREDEGKAKAAYWRKQRGIEHYIGRASLSLSEKRNIFSHSHTYFLTFILFKIMKYMLGIYILALSFLIHS